MNDSFCVLPFYAYESYFGDKNIYCCRLKDSSKITQVQSSIINNERNPNCQACWDLEDHNMPSERQIYNRTLSFISAKSLKKLRQQVVDNVNNTQIIKLATSNLCNATCVTCDGGCSTSWNLLENKPINYKRSTAEYDQINWSTIKQLSFVGGEPLLEKKNFEILQKILDANNKNCFVSIVTNGSIKLNKHKLSLLEQFRHLNICVSIDGTESVFEYLRFPLKWNDIVQNLEQFKLITNRISASCMISNLNVLYYPKIIKWFQEQNIGYSCRQIIDPDVFQPNNLPPYLLEKINIISPNSFTLIGSPFNNIRWQNFKSEIKRQDSLKNIQIKHYLPEFINLLQEDIYL